MPTVANPSIFHPPPTALGWASGVNQAYLDTLQTWRDGLLERGLKAVVSFGIATITTVIAALIIGVSYIWQTSTLGLNGLFRLPIHSAAWFALVICLLVWAWHRFSFRKLEKWTTERPQLNVQHQAWVVTNRDQIRLAPKHDHFARTTDNPEEKGSDG